MRTLTPLTNHSTQTKFGVMRFVIYMPLVIVLVYLSATPVAAARIKISMEELFKSMPIIFEGKVTEIKETEAPNHDLYLTNQTKALSVTFKIVKSWKGTNAQNITIYTWPSGQAPCTGVEIKEGKTYIVWAEWDKTKKDILFDFCGGFLSGDAPDAQNINEKLNNMFGPQSQMDR
jgi:hypothetical protein